MGALQGWHANVDVDSSSREGGKVEKKALDDNLMRGIYNVASFVRRLRSTSLR